MKRQRHNSVPRDEYQTITDDFTVKLMPVIAIAKRYGVSRACIYKILKKLGVNTTKGIGNTMLEVSCDYCQKVITRNKAKIRNQIRNFCNFDCYYSFIRHNNSNGPYRANRHGQRIAREKVSQVFDLQSGNVVHHVDRDCYNNRWDNLMVFVTNGDHLRFHRLGPEYVEPLWVGTMDLPEVKIGHYTDNYTD